MNFKSLHSKHFVSIPLNDGELLNLSNNKHPTLVNGWGFRSDSIKISKKGTHFCYIINGPSELTFDLNDVELFFQIHKGMFFSLPRDFKISGGCGIVISCLHFKGTFNLGGPTESSGRLKYIDGCSDSLLIPPIVKGAPCLNHLHFPPNISQTRHTHPSIRIGIVINGYGRCITPHPENSKMDQTYPLEPKNLFLIPAEGKHSFFTDDSKMDVIAYHPDSDTGPDHLNHPMINRTIVDGVSASKIRNIQTK